MSISGCLARLVDEARITPQEAKDAQAIHDDVLNDDALRDMDEVRKEGYAAMRTARIIDERAKARKANLPAATNRFIENTRRIDAHPDGAIPGLMALYDRDFRNRPGAGTNVTSLERDLYRPAIINKIHEFDAAYAPKLLGLKDNVRGIRDWIDETFDLDSGDPAAKAAAAGTKNANDWAMQKAMEMDKTIRQDPHWGRPQRWESRRVRKFGEGQFLADSQNEIATGGMKIFDPKTFQLARDGGDQERITREAARHIQMDLEPGAATSPFRPESRVFRFEQSRAGAESYKRMMDKYGPGPRGYFDMMQSHFEAAARNLALMHQFGPNYVAQIDQLTKYAIEKSAERSLDPPIRKSGEKLADFLMRWTESPYAAKTMQKFMTGQLSHVESRLMATVFSGMRAFMTAAKLGGAPLAAVPGDTVNALMAANFRGLASGRLLAAVVRNLFVNDPEREALALRLGIITNTVSTGAVASARFGDELIGRGALQKLARAVIRVTGLHRWDDALRSTFSQEFLASIGDRAGAPFDKLDAPFTRFMRDYGFTPEDWGKISNARMIGPGPVKFLLPSSIADEALRVRLLSAIGDVKQFAYLAGGSNRLSALATAGAPRGTWAREASQSFFQFKTFAASMLMAHAVRAIQEAAAGRPAQLALGLMAGMGTAGALTIQAKQIVQGKDPRNMADPWFWAQAFAQGGGAGILGDFLKDAFSREKSTLTETALGPWAQVLTRGEELLSSSRREAVEGEKVNFGAILARDLRDFTPGSGVWYARLLFDRFVFDQIQRMIDPDYARSFRREQERQEKLYGQKFYWAPGELAPARGPDIGAAVP